MDENIKKIRGVDSTQYANYMHQIERGESNEEDLIKKKLLLPGKGIALHRDDKIFHQRSKIKGKKKSGQCLVPHCTNHPSRRGLCNTHRTYAKRMIKMGKANEINLINRGLLLPREGSKIISVPRRHASAHKKPCLFPNCNKERRTSGLCRRHHNIYLRKAGRLGQEKRKQLKKDLIHRGLLLPEQIENKDFNAFELGSKIRGKIRKYK